MTILTAEQFAAEKDATLTSIIERMYDNPEEFNDTNRWHWLTSRINSRRNDDMNGGSTSLPFLTPEEFQRLWDAYMYVNYRNFAKETARAIINTQAKEEQELATFKTGVGLAQKYYQNGLSNAYLSTPDSMAQKLQAYYEARTLELERKLKEAQREVENARGARK